MNGSSRKRLSRPGSRPRTTATRGTEVSRLRSAMLAAAAGSTSQDHFVDSDLSSRPVPPFFNAKIPRSIVNQIVWQRASTSSVITTSTTTFTETNFAPTVVTGLAQSSIWLSLFDQYYLHSFSLTISSLEPPGSTGSAPYVCTALDYDSSANLGGIQNIQNYASCNTSSLAPGASVTRIVQPCNASYLANTATAGVNRTWVDSANNAVLFYAIRSIVGQASVASSTLLYTLNYNWCFRNTI